MPADYDYVPEPAPTDRSQAYTVEHKACWYVVCALGCNPMGFRSKADAEVAAKVHVHEKGRR